MLDAIPGISYAFAQPIDMRVQEMIIGARGDVVVKVFGDDIDELNRWRATSRRRSATIPGATDVFALRNDGHALSHRRRSTASPPAGFGLNAADIQDALRVWVDGRQTRHRARRQRAHAAVHPRRGRAARAPPADLARVPIVLPERRHGRAVARSPTSGSRTARSRSSARTAQRFATVLANVRGRDLVGFVAEAKAAVAQRRDSCRRATRSTGAGSSRTSSAPRRGCRSCADGARR